MNGYSHSTVKIGPHHSAYTACSTSLLAASERGVILQGNGGGRLAARPLQHRCAVAHTRRPTHLSIVDENSTDGSIGRPSLSSSFEMSNTAATVATAIHMLSIASQRPGHILGRPHVSKGVVVPSRRVGRRDAHRRPKPNAASGGSFVPRSAFSFASA